MINKEVIGWDAETRQVVLIAPNEYVRKLWRKWFPGVTIKLGQKLPYSNEQPRK